MESSDGLEPEINFSSERRVGGMKSVVLNFVCSLTKVKVYIAFGVELSKVYVVCKKSVS